MAKKLKVNEGDWICSEKSCGNINFSWRTKCNKCGRDKGKVDTFKKTGAEIGKNAAGKSGGLFSCEDWQCSMCGNVNWARRSECNVCQHPKYNRIEARTGLGGGYCERDNVEYIDREESDDEIDEFGRKKKKFRKKSDNHEKKKEEEKQDEEEEEDDESVDLSKYELVDSDAEGDSDADVSKYDLATSDAEDNQSEQKTSVSAGGRVVGSSKESSSSTGRSSRSRSKERRRSRSSSRERRHSRSRSRSPRHWRRSRSRSRSPRRHHRRSNRSRSRSRERRRSYRSRSRSRERHY